jgi:hypothetical protein
MRGRNAGLAAAARIALEQLSKDDSRRVSAATLAVCSEYETPQQSTALASADEQRPLEAPQIPAVSGVGGGA